MTKKSLLVLSAAILAILVLALWLKTRQTPSTESGRAEVIGAILPLTGSGAEFGKDELIGAQIAIDQINAAGNTSKLHLLVEDSHTQPSDGVSAYLKLLGSRNRPKAIITVMSSVSSALAPLAQRDGIPLFCVAAAPSLTRDRDFVFRALPTSDYQADSLLRLSEARLGYKTVSILYVTDEFGTSMESAFATAAEGAGVKVLRSEGITTDATDFRPGLSKLIASHSDVIFIAAFGSVLGSAVRQLRELGYEGTLLTTLEIGYPKVLDVAGSSAEGAIFVDTKFDPNATDPATRSFVKEFVKRSGRQPSLDAVLAFDEIHMISSAASHRGFGGRQIRDGLLAISNYHSINGLASIQPSGDVAYHLRLKTIHNGKALAVDE